MAWGRLAVDSALEVEDDRWEATGAAARGTELLSGQTDELPARLPLAAALTAVGCIFAVSRPLMPYGALRPAITDPRRVGVSPDAAPRRHRHGTATEPHRASRTIGHTPARPRDFSSRSVSPKQGGYQHRTRGSEKRGGRCVGGSVLCSLCLVVRISWFVVMHAKFTSRSFRPPAIKTAA